MTLQAALRFNPGSPSLQQEEQLRPDQQEAQLTLHQALRQDLKAGHGPVWFSPSADDTALEQIPSPQSRLSLPQNPALLF